MPRRGQKGVAGPGRPATGQEKNTAHQIYLPNTEWTAIPLPRSQWVREAIQERLERLQREMEKMAQNVRVRIHKAVSDLPGSITSRLIGVYGPSDDIAAADAEAAQWPGIYVESFEAKMPAPGAETLVTTLSTQERVVKPGEMLGHHHRTGWDVMLRADGTAYAKNIPQFCKDCGREV